MAFEWYLERTVHDMKTRQIITLVLVTIMVISVSACGGSKTKVSETEESTTTTIEATTTEATTTEATTTETAKKTMTIDEIYDAIACSKPTFTGSSFSVGLDQGGNVKATKGQMYSGWGWMLYEFNEDSELLPQLKVGDTLEYNVASGNKNSGTVSAISGCFVLTVWDNGGDGMTNTSPFPTSDAQAVYDAFVALDI